MFVFDSKMGPKSSSSRVSKRTNPDELHELRRRLRSLEHALSKSNPLHTPETSVCDAYSEEASQGTEVAGVDDRVRFLPDCSFRGKHGKTRYFGRSHYTTTVSFVGDLWPLRVDLRLIPASFKTSGNSCDVDMQAPKIRSIVT